MFAQVLGMSRASAILGIHSCTLRNWTEQGKIPHVRDSAGRRLFDEAVVVELARERKKAASVREVTV